jgi:hypothetical protein
MYIRIYTTGLYTFERSVCLSSFSIQVCKECSDVLKEAVVIRKPSLDFESSKLEGCVHSSWKWSQDSRTYVKDTARPQKKVRLYIYRFESY